MRFLLFIVSMLFITQAHAHYLGFSKAGDLYKVDSVSIVVGIYTTHITGNTFSHYQTEDIIHYNESNDYYAIRFNTDSGYQLSFARLNNSYYRKAYSIGIHKDLYRITNNTNIGAELLMSTGYGKYHETLGTDMLLAPSSYFKLDNGQFGVKVSYIALTVVAVTFEFKIW